MTNCICHNPIITFTQSYDCYIGMDETDGRFGEVSIRKCLKCNELWLYYFLEYHFHSRSDRWFRGIITTENAPIIKANQAIDYLNSLEWHFRGGSFFEGKRYKSSKVIDHLYALL